MADTITAAAQPEGDTATGTRATPVSARIDFVDVIFYASLALMIDGVGMLPVVGYVTSPLGIGMFRIWFWLKGYKTKSMNMLMGVTGLTEIIPTISEVFPGVTGYVLTTCGELLIEQRFQDALAKTEQEVAEGRRKLTYQLLVAQATNEAEEEEAEQENEETEQSEATAGLRRSTTATAATRTGSGATEASTPDQSPVFNSSTQEGRPQSGNFEFDLTRQAGAQVQQAAEGGAVAGGQPAVRPNENDDTSMTGKSRRFAEGNPTAPGPGPIYSLEEARRKKRRRAA